MFLTRRLRIRLCCSHNRHLLVALDGGFQALNFVQINFPAHIFCLEVVHHVHLRGEEHSPRRWTLLSTNRQQIATNRGEPVAKHRPTSSWARLTNLTTHTILFCTTDLSAFPKRHMLNLVHPQASMSNGISVRHEFSQNAFPFDSSLGRPAPKIETHINVYIHIYRNDPGCAEAADWIGSFP